MQEIGFENMNIWAMMGSISCIALAFRLQVGYIARHFSNASCNYCSRRYNSYRFAINGTDMRGLSWQKEIYLKRLPFFIAFVYVHAEKVRTSSSSLTRTILSNINDSVQPGVRVPLIASLTVLSHPSVNLSKRDREPSQTDEQWRLRLSYGELVSRLAKRPGPGPRLRGVLKSFKAHVRLWKLM